METPVTQPDIAPTPVQGPACTLCGGPAVVHWQRRLTADEVAVEQAKEQARRDEITRLADPDKPAPVFPPLPDCADYTRAVHACYGHAITPQAGALIHQAACTAPTEADLPGCDCTPEPAPAGDSEPPAIELPPGW